MVREKDIINGLCKADTCSVPDGYFASLQARLVSIPKENGRKKSSFSTVVPYLALAASLAAVVTVGALFLRGTAQQIEAEDQIILDGSLYEQMLYADALPKTYSLIDFYEDAADEADATLEDYYDYINH